MIPNYFLDNVLIPLDLDKNPLKSLPEVLSCFDENKIKSEVLHLDKSILKDNIIKIFEDRGLFIEKIDVWKWYLKDTVDAMPHSDGDFDSGHGRQVGINWVLDRNFSSIDFYDHSGEKIFIRESDGRTHTFWKFDDQLPLISWNTDNPSLINTQYPHHINGPKEKFRYSITIKFVDNPKINLVLEKLWDLRLDKDSWPSNISFEDWSKIKEEIVKIECINGVVPNLQTPIISYKIPIDNSTLILEILNRYIKRKVKSLRIFKMTPHYKAGIHIDYDQWLKIVPKYALNIPLTSCLNSHVNFYRNLGDQGADSDDKSGVGGYLYPKDYSLVYFNTKLEMTNPTLVRINVPHEVDNYSGENRKILSIRFFEEEDDLPSVYVKK